MVGNYDLEVCCETDVTTARLECDDQEPFRLDGGRVPGDWIDYNGHMVDASYAIAFSTATAALLEWLGIGSDYAWRDGGTMYTAEMHLSFLREVREGERLAYSSVVAGVDDKRLHILHTLLAGDDGERPSTTCELLFLHADHATHRVVPFPPEVRARLAPGQRGPGGALTWDELGGLHHVRGHGRGRHHEPE
jgi:acyl-CoA thioester hydrolase